MTGSMAAVTDLPRDAHNPPVTGWYIDDRTGAERSE